MGKKNKNKKEDKNDQLVFTTGEVGNSFFSHIDLRDSEETLDQDDNKSLYRIRVSRDRKNRGGKEVTLILGLEDLNEEALLTLGKSLKSKCGVGGTVKDGEIIIQGNHVNKVVELLKKEGFTDVKRSGG